MYHNIGSNLPKHTKFIWLHELIKVSTVISSAVFYFIRRFNHFRVLNYHQTKKMTFSIGLLLSTLSRHKINYCKQTELCCTLMMETLQSHNPFLNQPKLQAIFPRGNAYKSLYNSLTFLGSTQSAQNENQFDQP